MTGDCPFCRYAAGAFPPEGVAGATADAVWFQPLNPAAPGHMLVIPERHVRTISELTEAERNQLFFAVTVVYERAAIQEGVTGLNVVIQDGADGGQSVEHLHVHVVPRRPADGLGYRWVADR